MSAEEQPELTLDESRFVEEYLVDHNATQAYLRLHPNVKYLNAAQAGSKLSRQPHIKAAIRLGLQAQNRRTQVRADRVVRALARIAFGDLGQAFDLSTSGFVPRAPRDVPYELRCVLQVVKHKKRVVRKGDKEHVEEEVEYRLPDKVAALDRLMKHLGLYKDLPLLEVLLDGLEPEIADQVRAALAAAVDGGRGGAGGGQPAEPALGPAAGGPEPAVPGDGLAAGPVADELSDERGDAGVLALFETGREIDDDGGPGDPGGAADPAGRLPDLLPDAPPVDGDAAQGARVLPGPGAPGGGGQ